MMKQNGEDFLGHLLAYGTFSVTIFVITTGVTDPVNIPKLILLSCTAFASISYILASSLRKKLIDFKFEISLVILFVVFTINATIHSKSPISQNFFGAYGRNNGLLTYFLLSTLLISTFAIRKQENFAKLLKFLVYSGLVNVVYCLWVISFGDFVGWSNPYGNILGTLGNPNFIGSFLGIFISVLTVYYLSNSSKKVRIAYFPILLVTGLEIYKSHAIQGRVVALAGICIATFYFLRSRSSKLVLVGYVTSIAVIGFFSLMGALQKGPLSDYVYKTSVSLRGQYWLAGWNTGARHPFSGVGMDAFGDWYRRARDLHAIELPGVNTVVNASHNVPIDMFAFGGWPLLATYSAIMLWTSYSIVRFSLRNKEFSTIFVGLTVAWFGYQIQSIISINQIGLAIWGWILSGSLICLEKIDRLKTSNLTKTTKKIDSKASIFNDNLKAQTVAALGAAIGLIISLPPLISDTKWRSAQVMRSADSLALSLESNVFNPSNTSKYLGSIQAFEQSQLFDLSHKYALEAVNFNPEAFELWKVLYLIKNSTSEEKDLALKNMKRLDPLNPDVTSTK